MPEAPGAPGHHVLIILKRLRLAVLNAVKEEFQEKFVVAEIK